MSYAWLNWLAITKKLHPGMSAEIHRLLDRFDKKPEYRTLCKCFGCKTRFVQAETGGGLCCPVCDSRCLVETYGDCLTDVQATDWVSRAF